MENFERPPWEEAPRKRKRKTKMTIEQIQEKLLEWAKEAKEKHERDIRAVKATLF